jgi:hypothetical protein
MVIPDFAYIYDKFIITSLLLMLVTRTLIFAWNHLKAFWILNVKLNMILLGSNRKFFLNDFETVKCWLVLELAACGTWMNFFWGRKRNCRVILFFPWYWWTYVVLGSWLHIDLVGASKQRVMKLEQVHSELIWN